MDFSALLFVPMFYKHAWTAVNSRRGRYPRGLWAKAVALYEAAFYVWALARGGPLWPLVLFMAAVHFLGVPLYFAGVLGRYSQYGVYYSLFEVFELAVLAALFFLYA